MYIVRISHILSVAVLFFCSIQAGYSHPVAQGSLEVKISNSQIEILARVSEEEILVASALGAQTSHGNYLLNHLRIRDQNGELLGHIVNSENSSKLAAPQGESRNNVFKFVFEASTSNEKSEPIQQIEISENVLNEFEFAPGNYWEASYVVRIEEAGRIQDGLLLTSRNPLKYRLSTPNRSADSEVGIPQIDRQQLFYQYFVHGFHHILNGYDHLLFMGALVLAALTLWDLFLIVSAFTLAHTITLVLATLNIVRISSYIVEPVIAASIVFVSLQNIFMPERSRGRARLLVAFGFGLFHGLGFAGGLLDAMQSLSGLTVGVAIIAFSFGVELGHQCVVLPIFAMLSSLKRYKFNTMKNGLQAQSVVRYGSALISILGMYYLACAIGSYR